jgi:inner membrane protein
MSLLVGALFGTVLALDIARPTLAVNVLTTGLVDEPAHLATVALGLLALSAKFLPPRRSTFAWSALIASVAIDLDHLPLYTGTLGIAHGGRPYTHSLLIVVLGLVTALAVRRFRAVLLGVALGCALHLVRDVATGPGVPLWWPMTESSVRVPYWMYLCVLFLLAVIAVWRDLLLQTQPRSDPSGAVRVWWARPGQAVREAGGRNLDGDPHTPESTLG